MPVDDGSGAGLVDGEHPGAAVNVGLAVGDDTGQGVGPRDVKVAGKESQAKEGYQGTFHARMLCVLHLLSIVY